MVRNGGPWAASTNTRSTQRQTAYSTDAGPTTTHNSGELSGTSPTRSPIMPSVSQANERAIAIFQRITRRRRGYANSLNGLKTLSPGRVKSRSFPVAIVRPWRCAVAAM